MSRDAAALRDEIELRTRSLEDARREHASGELDDATLEAIERREGELLAAASSRLASLAPPPPSPDEPVGRRSARRPRWLLVVAGASVAVAAATLALAAADPFARATAPPRPTRAEKVAALLVSGELLLGQRHPLRALTAFEAARRLDPTSPEALVETAWLRYEFAGLGAHDPAQTRLGLAELGRAVRVVPRDAGAHLYYGIALLSHPRHVAAARAQLLEAASLPERPDEQSLTATMLRYVTQLAAR